MCGKSEFWNIFNNRLSNLRALPNDRNQIPISKPYLMLNYIIVCLSFIIISCNPNSQQETRSNDRKLEFGTKVKDTLITYNIEGISAEGAECKASYVSGKIVKGVTNIFGETGQVMIVFEFEANRIKVLESKYNYKTELKNVKSEKDMELEYGISYFIDFKGNVIGKPIQNRIDIFEELKKTVPFELK
jgi:hypothetical protein